MMNAGVYPTPQNADNMPFVQAQPVVANPQMGYPPMNMYPQPAPVVTMPPAPQLSLK